MSAPLLIGASRREAADSTSTTALTRPRPFIARRVERAALRKLLILDAAETFDDLRVPPGNRLEKLESYRAGAYSVRVNQQWRICFRWTDAGPEHVEIVDYH